MDALDPSAIRAGALRGETCRSLVGATRLGLITNNAQPKPTKDTKKRQGKGQGQGQRAVTASATNQIAVCDPRAVAIMRTVLGVAESTSSSSILLEFR